MRVREWRKKWHGDQSNRGSRPEKERERERKERITRKRDDDCNKNGSEKRKTFTENMGNGALAASQS